jgi:carboxymethylenebutenolidase
MSPSEDRRNFIATLLGAGFALAVQPVMAQTVVNTESNGLVAGLANFKGDAGAVAAYYARPEQGSNWPVVLVVSEIFGVHEHIADVCRRLAHQGYLAVAPELFARYGDPRTMSDIPKILSEIVAKVPDGEVLADLDACVVWARGQGGDAARLAITGFCWGGRIVWLYAARNPALKAGIAWYGKLRNPLSALTPSQPMDLAGQLKAPVLGLYGGQDQGIPPADVAAMNDALKAAGGKSYIHVYPDAPHAFNADYRPSYRKEPAEDGWRRLLAWLKANGV